MEEKSCPIKKTSIGGQALLEGIMMRGPKKTALAVRNPEGEIVLEDWENPENKRPKITKAPFVRGIFSMYDSLKLGYKCLMRSAEISGLDEEEEPPKNSANAKKKEKNAEDIVDVSEETSQPEADDTENPEETVPEEVAVDADTDNKKDAGLGGIMVLSTLLGFALALVLFVYLPTLVSTWILGENATTEHPVWLSVISGAIKVIILIGYMAAVSMMKDIRRTFMYHGAEHKSIFCYEAGLPLTVENVRIQKRFHPRCGTSFLFLTVMVSVIVMIPVSLFLKAVLPASILEIKALYTLIRTGIALLLLPLIAGGGYELIKLAGRSDNFLTRIFSAPGLWMQRITTKEPDDSMIECAIAALTAVIPDDGSDRW